MTNSELGSIIANDAQRIATAISAGALWEIWMQVELALLLRFAGMSVARELRYSSAAHPQLLDLACRDGQGRMYAIELKVESATKNRSSLNSVIMGEIAKLSNYPLDQSVPGGARYVVGIAYSAPGKQALQSFASEHADRAVYDANDSIGILVVTV